MTTRLGLLLLLLLLVACGGGSDDPDAQVPLSDCGCAALDGPTDGPAEGTRQCGEDGDSIVAFEDGAWHVVDSCGEGHHCTNAYCVCDPGSRCTGASTAEACCGNDTGPPVGPQGCDVDPDLDN